MIGDTFEVAKVLSYPVIRCGIAQRSPLEVDLLSSQRHDWSV